MKKLKIYLENDNNGAIYLHQITAEKIAREKELQNLENVESVTANYVKVDNNYYDFKNDDEIKIIGDFNNSTRFYVVFETPEDDLIINLNYDDFDTIGHWDVDNDGNYIIVAG